MAIRFRNDYSELAHPNVLNALVKANNVQHGTYGLDAHSENAKKLIKETFNLTNSEIHFVTGGTQANLLVISYFLRPYEGVICCDTGHINVHETAAVEATGHKIYTVKNVDGKILKEDVVEALRLNNNEHTVKLKMVYISNSSETGTIYNKKELEELYQVCKENDLILFIDGARLASALTSKDNDIEIKDFASLCDVFYIGGTKNGLMSGEAIVLNNVTQETYFRHHIKNKGAMLAKGYALGIQFEEIFTNNLYFDIAKHANKMADLIKENLLAGGVKVANSPTNQIFVTLSKKASQLAIEKYDLELWEEKETENVVRIVTSFNTNVESCKELINDIISFNKL